MTKIKCFEPLVSVRFQVSQYFANDLLGSPSNLLTSNKIFTCTGHWHPAPLAASRWQLPSPPSPPPLPSTPPSPCPSPPCTSSTELSPWQPHNQNLLRLVRLDRPSIVQAMPHSWVQLLVWSAAKSGGGRPSAFASHCNAATSKPLNTIKRWLNSALLPLFNLVWWFDSSSKFYVYDCEINNTTGGCCCCLQLSPRDCCQSCFCLSAVAVGQLLCVNSLAPSSCALSSAFFLSSHPSTSIPASPPSLSKYVHDYRPINSCDYARKLYNNRIPESDREVKCIFQLSFPRQPIQTGTVS